MQIPDGIKKQVINNETERVILLAMSTLPQSKSIVTYQYSNEIDFVFKGISQLEAGTKYFLQKAAMQGIRIDRIVIMASDEAASPNKNYVNDKNEAISAVDLYIERIAAFISGHSNDTVPRFGCEEVKAKDTDEVAFKGKSLYQSTNFSTLFKVIVGTNDLNKMWKVSNTIKGNANRIELFLDMQGGDRNDIPLFSTVLELLEDHDFDVVERVATAYNGENEIQPIKTVDDQYRSYDLLTAYKVFMWYGHGKQLAQFFKENEKDKAVAAAVLGISDSIHLCDVSGFDKALSTLSSSLAKRSISGVGSSKTEMDFIIDKIKEDFGNLLDNDGKTKSLQYVGQIRWCLKHSFIQQALTIFESKMPTEFVRGGIDYYCDSESDRERIIKEFIHIYQDYQGGIHERLTYKMKDINHYWIRDLDRDKRRNIIHTNIEHKYGIPKREAISLKKDYEDLCQMRNMINHAADTFHNSNGFYAYMRSHFQDDRNFQDEHIPGIKSELEQYLNRFEESVNRIDKSIKKRIIDLA